VEQHKVILKGFRLPDTLVTRIEQHYHVIKARQPLGRLSMNDVVVYLLERGLDADAQEGTAKGAAVYLDAPVVSAGEGMMQCLLHKKKGTKEIVPVLYPAGGKCQKCAGNASQRQTQKRKREEEAQGAETTPG